MQILRLAALTQPQALSFEELFRLASRAEETCVPAGRRLLLDSGRHDGLALIAAGSGVVRCAGEAIGKLGPGDVFGALSMRHSSRRPRRCTSSRICICSSSATTRSSPCG